MPDIEEMAVLLISSCGLDEGLAQAVGTELALVRGYSAALPSLATMNNAVDLPLSPS
jgi:hypothetical protein